LQRKQPARSPRDSRTVTRRETGSTATPVGFTFRRGHGRLHPPMAVSIARRNSLAP
jgi:hypothetical protein